MKKVTSFILVLFFGIQSILAQAPLNSLDFDGTDDYVSSSLPTVFNDIPNNDFTIETWIKPAIGAFSRVIFAQLDADNFACISLTSLNEVVFYVQENTVNHSTQSADVIMNRQWTHIAATWNAMSAEAKIYINGTEVSYAPGLFVSSTGLDSSMTIGSRTNAAQYFEGELDELRIWDVERTDCEISVGMNSEITVAQPNLVAYYNFNEGIAGGANTGVTSLADFTTNYDGTLLNFGLTGANSNWLTSGASIRAANQTNGSATRIDSITACGSFTWIDGINYTSSNNTATFNIVGGTAKGCDSVAMLALTINSVSDLTTSTIGTTVSANNAGATYQWLDCDNDYAILSGENGQSYTAITNGNYAVELTENGCVDTTACAAIISVGIPENSFGDQLAIYPNPTNGDVSVDFGKIHDAVNVTITDINGRLILSSTYWNTHIVNLNVHEPAGIYLLTVESDEQRAVIRLAKR